MRNIEELISAIQYDEEKNSIELIFVQDATDEETGLIKEYLLELYRTRMQNATKNL